MNLDIETTQLTKVKNITIPDIFNRRMKSGVRQLDVLFDDGILPGSAATLTAQAGCGKTTFMLQMLNGLAKNGYKVGYFSGEESIYQLAYTANRVKTGEVPIANETDIDAIKEHMEDLDLVVVDSFQALTSSTKMNSRQLEKYAVQSLTRAAKDTECCVVFIMHLTKSGDLKGGTVVPHTVDANLKIDRVPNADEGARVIYFEKNRFGPLNELECIIGAHGYDFKAKVVKEDDGKSTKKATPKKKRKELEKEKIIEYLKSNGACGLSELAALLEDNVTRTQYVLRELTVLGRIEKWGRGAYADWELSLQEKNKK
jgi:predicted ATP-dependent serine protease